MRSFRQLCFRAMLAASMLPTGPVFAQPPVNPQVGSGKRPRVPQQAGAEQAKIYLRFVGRTWDDVLKSVAQDNGQSLVMPEIPPGRFTRYDHSGHTISEVVRILNHELRSTGFQIMSKGDYLIVLRDDRFRPEYTRPEMPNRSGSQLTQAGQEQQAESREAADFPVQQASGDGAWQKAGAPALLVPSELQTAEHEQFIQPGRASLGTSLTPVTPRPVTPEAKTAATEKPAAAPSQRQALVVEPKHFTATELSRQIYKAYGKQAKLVQEGPLGLPAFEVKVPGSEQRPAREFVIGIDQPQNQLVLVAGEETQAELLELIEQLDISLTPEPGRSRPQRPRLMTAPTEIHQAAAEQLPKVLAQLTQNQDPNGNPPIGDFPMPAFGQPQLNGGQNGRMNGQQPNGQQPNGQRPNGQRENGMPAGEAADGPASLNEILDRLRGDVSIESLNDLGLLILRGNESDVEGVMQIIRSIENMSAGTTPEIHLRHLEHVNSEALTTLLNSVYEAVQNIDRRASRANRRVSVIAVVQPNAVLIVAPSLDLESVLALIEELDHPIDPEQEVKLFRLKNATAPGAVTLLQEFYANRGGLGSRLRVSADARTNTLVVQANPKDLKEIEVVIRDIDKDESHAVSRLQLFPLKNAVAEELATFINTAISEALNPRQATGQFGGQFQQQGQQGLNQPKSFVLEFLAGSGSQTELMRSGILADIRVSADARTNSLAVIAPERSLPLFAALIKALDKPSDAVAEVKVFTLTHADANSALTLLQQLFDQTATTSPLGLNLAGATDTGSSLLPIRFSIDVRSNSILAIGGGDALTVVEAILLRLDNEAPRKRTNTVLKLKNTPVTDVALAINQFLESQRQLSQINTDLVSAVELLEREVIVVPEVLSNNLLISATPEYYNEILRIARELDAAPAQVVIQALLVEVQLDNVDEFGVELGFQDSVLFNRSLLNNVQTITNTVTNQNIQTTTQQIISQEGAPGFLFNNPGIFPNLGNNIGPASNPNAVGTQGLANFGVGRVNGDLGFGGLVLSASSESVSVLIRALAQQRNVQVLSRPQIRTVDSQLAQIQVGQRVPIVNGVNISGQGIANPNIEYDEAGIILSVTPRINPDGQIVMEVVAERSAYRTDGVPIFTDTVSGAVISSPIKDISVARATVGVTDGQTIVLGGMISETDAMTTRKVPWLGDIPLIGRLFRYDNNTNVRSELLIFLTPRVLHNDCDSEVLKEIEAGRIHFFREEAEEIHGPLFGVPIAEEFMPAPMMSPAEGVIFSEQDHFTPAPLPSKIPGGPDLPLSPPALDDDVPRTMVPEGSLKPMSHETPATPPQKKGKSLLRSRPGVTRVFD